MGPDPQGSSETYVITDSMTESMAEVATLIETIDKIDLYIQDQLEQFLRDTGFTLRTLLSVDEPITLDDRELMAGLISDLSNLHRQQVLAGVRLLIIEPLPGRTGAYRILYQSRYRTDPGGLTDAGSPPVTDGEAGGKLRITREIARGETPVLLLEWREGLSEWDIRMAQGSEFYFQWQPPSRRMDGSGLVTTSRGMLVTNGKVVVARSVSIMRDQVGR
ncbi:MAG TPA: hypothetical protein VGF38_08195 [Ktedonobacterales bacterium]|jgi:hypothetical protein